MAQSTWPDTVPAGANYQHRLKPYDAEAMLIEVDLLLSWFVPHMRGQPMDPDAALEFAKIWRNLVALAMPDKPVWTLRDYHSPNLIWIPERQGLRRVGIIDTQDAVLGHPAYDLVSMCQDARVDVAPEMEAHIFAHYCALRTGQGPFDEAAFRSAYAVLGAQRATKILGIFARLFVRDGKPAYLRHIPRVAGYLSRNLKHPALSALRHWYERHLPEALKGAAP
jgi:aminoglycoside/choline kinase family phosphotransferase